MVPKSLSGVGIGNLIKKKNKNKQTNKQKTNFSPV
jgi:hypothetical protein